MGIYFGKSTRAVECIHGKRKEAMKVKRSLAVACAVALGAGVAVADTSGRSVGGKVLNFEQGVSGWRLKSNFSVMKGEGMNGSAALVYENRDPKVPYVFPYSLPTFDMMLETGVYYRVSAMIRTEGLDPDKGHGATSALSVRR